MNADLLARNIAAHWVQSDLACGRGAGCDARCSESRRPGVRLVTLHLTFAATLLLPLVQPWQPGVSPVDVDAAETTEVILTKFFVAIVDTPTSPQFETPPSSLFNLWDVVLLVIAVGVVLRLLWLCGGIIRLLRLREREREIPVPDVARDFESALGVAPRYFEHREPGQPRDVRNFSSQTVMLPPEIRVVRCVYSAGHRLPRAGPCPATRCGLLPASKRCSWPCCGSIRGCGCCARAFASHVSKLWSRQVVELTGNRAEYVRCLVELVRSRSHSASSVRAC